MGRPRLDTEPITLRLPRTMIETIDDLRRDEADLPTRPEMIRRLLERVIGKRET
ncbi:ribbon-helix-helix protein, CopG family [Paracoccus alcaliphilus]|nr:ribbon-helix-helix protein, CopG family [Paracoccus alcaliphilus]